MLRNYLLIALRNLRRHPGYAFINVVGLAVGMACCVLIGLYVQDELSYDRFSAHAERTYRLVQAQHARTPAPSAPRLADEYPTLVEAAARVWPLFAPAKLRHDDVVFVEENLAFADAALVHVLGYDVRHGDATTALQRPGTMVLTASLARKYFGDADPVGRTMNLWGQELEVTGVMADVPPNAHYHPAALVSMPTLQRMMGADFDTFPMHSYVLLREGVSRARFEAALAALPMAPKASAPLTAQPLADIHFDAHVEGNPEPGGNRTYVLLLALVALFVLGLACVNFMNLATARSTLRAKEVGLRKTLGAMRYQLAGQFFGESLLLSGAALGLTLGLVTLAMPGFNTLAGKQIDLWRHNPVGWGMTLLGLWVFVGFVAGSYPALFLSRFRPARAFQSAHAGSSGAWVRRGLVVAQFTVAVVLLAGVAVVYGQLRYMQTRDLGYDQTSVLVLDGDRYPLLKQALAALPEVTNVTGAPQVMGRPLPSGRLHVAGADSARRVLLMPVTHDFVETMGMTLAEGRSFSEAYPADATGALLLNEAAVRMLGEEAGVGRAVTLTVAGEDGSETQRTGEVIGVVEDFHYFSLHSPIEPIALYLAEDPNLTFVQLANRDDETLARIRAAWASINPDAPFNAYFLGEHLRQAYRAERQLGGIFGIFSGLALFIACLGLLGLAAFTAEQRRRDIGVRKVLGATVAQIVAWMVRDVAGLVVVACVLAAPAAYFGMRRWLDGFAYRVPLGAGVFVAAGLAVLTIAVLTVSYHAVRAARANPVEALRSE